MPQYPTGPPICGTDEDPTCKVRITSATDGPLLVVYGYWGLNILSFTIFSIYKIRRLKRRPVEPFVVTQIHSEAAASGRGRKEQIWRGEKSEEVRLPLEEQRNLVFTGYKQTMFGTYCWSLAILTSVHWMALWMVLLLDTYNKCQVRGVDNLCFYGNYFIFGTYNFNGVVYFTLWWLMGIWYMAWIINRDQVQNWFRIPCSLSEASVVYVWAPHQREILCPDVSLLVRQARKLKNLVVSQERQGLSDTLKILQTENGTRFVLFQGHRFSFDGDSLHQSHFQVGSTYAAFLEASGGLSTMIAKSRLEELGPNEIPFHAEPFWFTIYDELFTLFHVYQTIMYFNYLYLAYLFMALLLIAVVVLSACVTIYTRRKSQLEIAKISEYRTDADVLRSGRWITIESQKMVPGDVVKLRSNWVLPCDAVLIKGFCVCDESSLTGESMPVQKYAAIISQDGYEPQGRGYRHTLFSGATVLQAGTCPSDEIIGVVSATGMGTSKGALLSTILYPERMIFKYDEELPIVFLCLLCYSVVCFVISLLFQNHNGQQSIWVTKFAYCSALFSQTVSPLLPVALEVGQLHSVERLKKLGVHCLNPKRIAIAGKIRVFCFDKTGTLTKNGLDFIGVHSSTRVDDRASFENQLFVLKNSRDINLLTMRGLATCHAVSRFGDQFVGNEVEVKMFSASGWDLIESVHEYPVVRKGKEKLTILKRHEFDHSRATMSVIVEDSWGVIHIYCKGSFEKIGDISEPASLPEDYLRISRDHALHGCYILGLSYRNLGKPPSREEILSLSRDQVEDGLSFVALLLFRNELKSDTRVAIENLKDGQVRPVMVTGDNAQTGHYIARKCGMVEQHVPILLGDIEQPSGRVTWSRMGEVQDSLEPHLSTEDLLREQNKGFKNGLLELAVTGKAFNSLCQTEMMTKLLFYTRIHARFTPEDKVRLVTMHRDQGIVVGMCGDGGNDCGALRAAHAGLALSSAEASVVSPFTSVTQSVSSVVDLVREGRGCLHTSLACYKFLIIYGLTFSILKLACNWYGVIACEMDYIIIDSVAVLVLGYTMTLSQPAKRLSKERPTSSLLSPQTVASTLGIWIMNIIFLIIAIVYMKNLHGYVPWPAKYSLGNSWWTLGDNWEVTVIFYTVYSQFVTTSFAFTFGSSFRRSVFLNQGFFISWVVIMFMVSCVLLLSENAFTRSFHMASEQFNRPNPENPVWRAYQDAGGLPSPPMVFTQRLRLWLIIFSNMVGIILWSAGAIDGPVAKLLARRFPSKSLEFLT
ncbi:hypothetical protein MPTK1_8g08050 [Marchantia polymorpha subsp. ruderalis]|uniref:P-type ATPase A domain-containing protein n=1 Tax=Marchantia polymorpha TaxID=3197 RepID=A0A2R6W4G0_MARPO|nr:hypothetical protein MARPO_0155s0012 [Marchantia polymorpha]BBN19120.1 hypothetical protein Mp_8g08050 [Marchantia polymorpha subsp. ruderalis]PTQ28749.1 hypothetical protein MARPO_0155s0012 [Marchantia polymorpha]PTQ28750.1 hypothetical protein MARPO_0155s0012 [Marchantia polymorpha]BBN19121.1 hypothetical protein Mp_8g08050 [Marchantia polymorpha subsp. ruderalis]|eukprot:PTQ28748.1 hypothetical protein MARPO_0155s0012 [Marchantia polymorpha]